MMFLDDDGDRNRRPLRQSILFFFVGAPLLTVYLWVTTWLGSLVCIQMGIFEAAKPWFGNPALAILSLFLGICFEVAAVMICLGFAVAAVEIGDRVLHCRTCDEDEAATTKREEDSEATSNEDETWTSPKTGHDAEVDRENRPTVIRPPPHR